MSVLNKIDIFKFQSRILEAPHYRTRHLDFFDADATELKKSECGHEAARPLARVSRAEPYRNGNLIGLVYVQQETVPIRMGNEISRTDPITVVKQSSKRV